MTEEEKIYNSDTRPDKYIVCKYSEIEPKLGTIVKKCIKDGKIMWYHNEDNPEYVIPRPFYYKPFYENNFAMISRKEAYCIDTNTKYEVGKNDVVGFEIGENNKLKVIYNNEI